jgi:hypothetical protein
MAVNTRPFFGVISLKGRFSLKNWTQKVILRHSESLFNRMCFLVNLKVLPGGLYVSNGLLNIPVPTYLLKTTVS